MRKIFFLLALLIANVAMAQVTFDLLPRNVIKHLGKTSRAEFEKLVGSPVGEDTHFTVYEVENAYDNIITAVNCTYCNDTVIALTFGTPYYTAYWLGMITLKSAYETKRTFREDTFGQRIAIYSWNGKFGCNILNIRETSDFSTATINYYLK